MERDLGYFDDIAKALDASGETYRHDEKTEYLMLACCYALTWIAEELHEMNERSKDG
jgi:hypothetical protein